VPTLGALTPHIWKRGLRESEGKGFAVFVNLPIVCIHAIIYRELVFLLC
jgi:hypothetical protein